MGDGGKEIKPPAEAVRAAFADRYGEAPHYVVRAPGRVNLIGEHTDYNDGFVLPMAIDRAVCVALRPSVGRRVRVGSLDFGEEGEFSLDALPPKGGTWLDYVVGVAWSLTDAGFTLGGWEGFIAGDVPVGAGLSSSAAVELAVARAFAVVSDLPWDPAAMAKSCQRAENQWVGVNCGIMDQMISASGKAGQALLIDCRTLDTKPASLPPETRVVILDTATRRGLVDSAYNERRRQCEAAARFFDVKALRDVSLTRFEAEAGRLDEPTRRRARHVVTEDERTLRAAEAMQKADAAEVGRLMSESHASLRDDFQVSTPELDAMVECGRADPVCYGIRMTGAGFGGCAVALVKASEAQRFAGETAARYQQRTGKTPHVYVCQATDGAGLI
jgi:galactokinase